MEINGFEIDVYNQYELKEGAKTSTCPLCSADRKKKTEKCMMLDWDRALGTCNHCGEVIQLHTYVRGSDSDKDYVLPEWKNNTGLSDKLVQWFSGRGISQQVLTKMRISEGIEWMPQKKKEINTVQFNYFQNEELINVKYRTADKCFKLHKGSEKIFYNIDGILNTPEAIIVEGEMDCLSFIESGINHVVSVPNGATKGNINLDCLDSSYQYFEDKERVYLCTDNDEPGINLRNELIRRLGPERCYLVDFKECKDANDFLMAYGAEKLKQVLIDAEPVPLENTITLNDEKEQLRDFYINGAKPGYQIGLESFDNIFSTYTSQFIVVTGIPSSGKSDFVDQMVTGYNKNYGWKTAFVSPENKPNYLHMDKICRKFYGKYPRKDDLDSVEWNQVEEHVNDNFFFVDYQGGYDLKSALEKGEELVKRKGIKCLVLDPYNKIRLKESLNKGINDQTNDYLTMIDNFCRKHDVLVILVAHPVKMKKERGETKLPEPTMYDVKGGGEVYDMSYHGLLVHRDYQLGTVMVKVLKVKFHHLGTNQADTNFVWSSINGRYNEIIGEPESHEVVWDNTNWISGEIDGNIYKDHQTQEHQASMDAFGGMELARGDDDNLPF